MSVSSISFWKQDQNYWSQAKTESESLSASSSLINEMGNLMVNQSKGLASIATQKALDRTNSALTSALQSAVAQVTGNTSGSSSTSSSATAAPTYTPPVIPIPASGTGTQTLATGTPLLSLGIPPQSGFTVSDGTNTTTYTTTGTDTVGDLINALNDTSQPNHAQITVYLNSNGDLTISALNNSASVSIGGQFAASLGFGTSNQNFSPTVAASNTSSGAGASGSNGSSTSGSTSSTSSSGTATSSGSGTNGTSGTSAAASTNSSGSTRPVLFNSAYALQTSGTAASLLSSSLSSATINLLA